MAHFDICSIRHAKADEHKVHTLLSFNRLLPQVPSTLSTKKEERRKRSRRSQGGKREKKRRGEFSCMTCRRAYDFRLSGQESILGFNSTSFYLADAKRNIEEMPRF